MRKWGISFGLSFKSDAPILNLPRDQSRARMKNNIIDSIAFVAIISFPNNRQHTRRNKETLSNKFYIVTLETDLKLGYKIFVNLILLIFK